MRKSPVGTKSIKSLPKKPLNLIIRSKKSKEIPSDSINTSPSVENANHCDYVSVITKLIECFQDDDFLTEGLLRVPPDEALKKAFIEKINSGDETCFKDLKEPTLKAKLLSTYLCKYFEQFPLVANPDNLSSFTEKDSTLHQKSVDCIIEASAPNTKSILTQVITLSTKVIKENATNKMSAENLAMVLSPNFMSDADKSDIKLISKHTSLLIYLFNHADNIVSQLSPEPTTAEPTTAEPATVEPTTVEPTTVEPATVEPATVEPATVEPTTVASTTVEPAAVESTTVEPATAEPSSTSLNEQSMQQLAILRDIRQAIESQCWQSDNVGKQTIIDSKGNEIKIPISIMPLYQACKEVTDKTVSQKYNSAKKIITEQTHPKSVMNWLRQVIHHILNRLGISMNFFKPAETESFCSGMNHCFFRADNKSIQTNNDVMASHHLPNI